VLLCKNLEGYENLVQLGVAAYLEGFYRKPRIDFELLKAIRRGSWRSRLPAGRGRKPPAAREIRLREAARPPVRELFGEGHFYLEIQDHHLDARIACVREILRLAKSTGLPLVCTNDCHYLRRNTPAPTMRSCAADRQDAGDTDRMRYDTSELYVKSPDEMKELFRHTPSAIENTVRIAEMCHLELEFGQPKLPRFPLPEGHASPESYLVEQAQQGSSGASAPSRPRSSTASTTSWASSAIWASRAIS